MPDAMERRVSKMIRIGWIIVAFGFLVMLSHSLHPNATWAGMALGLLCTFVGGRCLRINYTTRETLRKIKLNRGVRP